ncbi:MAG: hypothetical protein MAG794_01396 [Gammaproteobacteria bacterium]|nr:hypothetical protein [Gammaproteobacteria bacterium]
MRILFYAALVASLLGVTPTASGDKLYKWVDEDGTVTYQGRPPPAASGNVETLPDVISETTPSAEVPDVDVVLYSIKVCDACDLVRKLLLGRRVPFKEKNADKSPEVQAELKEVAGVLSVPVLLIGEQALKGYNKELILNELEEAGFTMSAETLREPGQIPQMSSDDLEGTTPEETEQATGDSAPRGEDNDLLEEDEGFANLNEDIFSDTGDAGADGIGELEEIPEDERVQVNQ